ncbi:MAG: hypothetical protein ACLQNE_28840 [Thermoguttaceae bacterium]|jgi:hypothetical protein
MNVTGIISFSLLAQVNAAPAGKSFFQWAFETLGTDASLEVLTAGVVVFLGSCFVVAKSRRPSVIASCLILLPLPSMVAVGKTLSRLVGSLAVLSQSSAAVAQLSGPQVAGGVAASLLPLSLALMVTWPSYLVLAVGLIVRTVFSNRGSLQESESV